MDSLPQEMQIMTWNILLLIQPVVLALIANHLISYRQQQLKSLNFVFLILAVFTLVDFIFEWTTSLYQIYDYVRIALSVILFVVIIPITASIIATCFLPKGEYYLSGKSYLVYKKPLNWCGLLALVFKAPYGHCFLVTKNRSFKFKNGRVIQENYSFQPDNLHIRIASVKLSEARELLGLKWSLRNNCFSVFQKFNTGSNA